MKILHLNYHQNQGGASISCNRLVNALNKNNIQSKLLVSKKGNSYDNVIGQFSSSQELIVHKVKKKLSIYIKQFFDADDIYKDSIAFFNSGLPKKIENSNFDIVNFHWISNEMISIEEIKKIKKPLVWTLVDMWPFIGSTHYKREYLSNKK